MIDDCAVNEAGPDAAEWIRDAIRRRSESFDTTYERDGEALVVDV